MGGLPCWLGGSWTTGAHNAAKDRQPFDARYTAKNEGMLPIMPTKKYPTASHQRLHVSTIPIIE